MAGVFRVGVASLINKSSAKPLVKATLPTITQCCNISGKSLRGTQKIEKHKPYPYNEKPYGFLNAIFDKTTKRFDDNSKVIIKIKSNLYFISPNTGCFSIYIFS